MSTPFDAYNNKDDNFQYDGVTMPRPSKYWIKYEEVNRDMERLLDTGEMVGQKIGDAKSIIWLYRWIDVDTYEILINTCVVNGGDSPFHTLKTLDHRDKPFTIEVYRAAPFEAEPDDEDYETFINDKLTDDVELWDPSNIKKVRTYHDVRLEFICKKVR